MLMPVTMKAVAEKAIQATYWYEDILLHGLLSLRLVDTRVCVHIYIYNTQLREVGWTVRGRLNFRHFSGFLFC